MKAAGWYLEQVFRLVVVATILSATIGCNRDSDARRVHIRGTTADLSAATEEAADSLAIAVGGMITPKEGFAYYRRFLDYIGDRLEMPVRYVDRSDYGEINALLKSGEVDAAFVCGGPYVDGHEDFGLELLAAPVAYDGTVYYSYIIVPKDSPARTFEDLRGKRFAFADPLSNTGKIVPTYMLARMDETPDSFFGEYFFTHAHDRSIQAVADGVVDGAAVDSLIWEYANRTNPVFTLKTRILKKSPPYGIPPVTVRPGLDPALKKRLQNVFVRAHADPAGQAILKGMMISRFTPISDEAYDSIREMKAWIRKQGPKGTAKDT